MVMGSDGFPVAGALIQARLISPPDRVCVPVAPPRGRQGHDTHGRLSTLELKQVPTEN